MTRLNLEQALHRNELLLRYIAIVLTGLVILQVVTTVVT